MPRKVVGGGHVGQNEPLAALVFGLPNCPTIFPPKTVFFRFKRKIEKKISAIRAQSKNMERKIVKKIIVPKFFWTPDSKNWPSCIIFPEGHCG